MVWLAAIVGAALAGMVYKWMAGDKDKGQKIKDKGQRIKDKG